MVNNTQIPSKESFTRVVKKVLLGVVKKVLHK